MFEFDHRGPSLLDSQRFYLGPLQTNTTKSDGGRTPLAVRTPNACPRYNSPIKELFASTSMTSRSGQTTARPPSPSLFLPRQPSPSPQQQEQEQQYQHRARRNPLARRTPEQVRRQRQEAYLGKVREGREEMRWESRSEQVKSPWSYSIAGYSIQ